MGAFDINVSTGNHYPAVWCDMPHNQYGPVCRIGYVRLLILAADFLLAAEAGLTKDKCTDAIVQMQR